LNKNENIAYETLSKKLNHEYYPEFKARWSDFLTIINQSIMSDSSKNSIGNVLNQKDNKLELNGELFLKDLKSESSLKIEDRLPEYLRFILEVIEKNPNIQVGIETHFFKLFKAFDLKLFKLIAKLGEGELFMDGGKKLDLIK
jgi:hypothetical protein